MGNLHSVIEVSRKILFGFVAVILGVVLLFIVIRLGGVITNILHPTPPAPPTVSFGKLPPPVFPKNVTGQKLSYQLNTVSGALPTFTDRATVYKLEQPQPDLLALQDATTLVAKSNFSNSPVALSESLYQWTNADTLPKTLTYDIVSHNFSLTSNYLSDTNVMGATNLSDEQAAINTANTFLENFSSVFSDIDNSKTKTTLFSINNNALVPASSLSTAQVIRVDYFQKNIENTPVYYGNPQYGNISIFVASSDVAQQVVEAHVFHMNVSEINATYPIKSAQTAFDDLKKGNAYIASYDGTSPTVTIRSVSLGYFIPDSITQYALPIIVFQGDDNFTAYVNAVTDVFVSK
ncbi:MAG: hypothetical protein ACREGI_01005 [Candidatus Levyibacteriota bacterium]